MNRNALTEAERIRNIRTYRPGTKVSLYALPKLVRELRVRHSDCSPMEKAGFTLLAKRGLIKRDRRGYWAPNYRTFAEYDAWFNWATKITGIE